MNLIVKLCSVLAAVFTALPRALLVVAPAFKGVRPDITPAMVLAVVKFVGVQAVAIGLMKDGTQAYILQVAGVIVPAVLVIVDLGLRSARNKAELAKVILPES